MLWAGSKAIEIWRNSGRSDKTPASIMEELQKHCIPSDHTFWSHRMEMRYMQQRVGETIQDFATRISTKAALCDWHHSEEQIVSTIIFGCSHKEAQRSILNKPKDLSLKDCIDHIAKYEATDKHLQNLQNIKTGGEATVNAIHNKKSCYNCGGHHNRGNCPAYGHKCEHCGKLNHLKRVCMSKSKPDDKRHRSHSRTRHDGNKPRHRKHSKHRQQTPKRSEPSGASISTAVSVELAPESGGVFCHIDTVHEMNRPTRKDVSDANILFKGTNIPFKVFCKIDTGADVTVMPARVYKTLCPENVSNNRIIGLSPTTTRLSAYNNTQIKCIGETSLHAYHDGNYKKVRVLITTGRRTCTILGKHDAHDLKCIKFLCIDSCQQCNSTAQINSVCDNKDSSQNQATSADTMRKWSHALPLGKLTKDPKQDLFKLFPTVFDGIGQLSETYTIELKEDATPVKHPPRRVPESLKPEIKKELDRLLSEDIIKPVTDATDWVNSLVFVTKDSGELRLCLDPKDLNKCIKRPHHYVPTIDDVLPELHGAKFLSTLDAKSGYWNIPLDPKSQLLTTFNTPGFGRFCFKRLPFGLVSSQDIFQKQIDCALSGLKNVKPIADDIKIHGTTELEHDIALLETCQRCLETGLKLNPNKCQIKKDSVTFFGNHVTTKGLQADPSKIQAILELAAPKDKQEVRSLIGLVTYLQRFIPNVSKLLEPIRKLLRHDTHFYWDANLEQTLDEIKESVSDAKTLAYFNHNAETTELQCDASKKGLGACLLQDGKPISFASKSLTQAEANYSNIKREALGVVFGLPRLHQYTYGCRIKAVTDHKPLESIFRQPLANVTPRLQRMLLRVQAYDFIVEYRPGNDIPINDCLSRLIPDERVDEQIDGMTVHIHTVIAASGDKIPLLQEHTACDNTLLQLCDLIQHGWPQDRSECPVEVLPYWQFRDELGYYNGILVKGNRALVPQSLRKAVLQEIHRGHMGIEKCRLRARQSVFWPSMNEDITQMVQSCDICATHAGPQKASYSMSIQDDSHYPMQRVGTDLFHWNGSDYLIVVDYYSSFPWIKLLTKSTTSEVIQHMKAIFAEYGIPQQVHSDSGSQFTSEEFTHFSQSYGFMHTLSSPYYHQSNGKAERYVGIVKNILTKTLEEGGDVYLALLAYRGTPLSSTKLSPGELMLGRKLRNSMINLPLHNQDNDDGSAPCETPYAYAPLKINDPVHVLTHTNRQMGSWLCT